MSEVRALVAAAVDSPLELREIQLDEPRPDETVVEIHAVGICHADIACLDGKLPASFPSVFGHEGAGVVKQVGSEVRGIEPNDTVLISYNSCGDCIQCREDFSAYCVHTAQLNFRGVRLDGSCTLRSQDGSLLHGNFFGQSSFSNLALVNSRSLVKVPSSIPMHLYAPLGCGVQTGAGAIWNSLRVQPGSTVAVFGTGSVGMAAIMAARIYQAKAIIGIDIHKQRLEVARNLGATHTLDASGDALTDASGDALTDQLRALCGDQGLMFAVDTTGIPAVIETMIASLGIRGRAVTIGAPKLGSTVKVDVLSHLVMGRVYMGSSQGDSNPTEMIPRLIEHHLAGRLPIEQFVTTYNAENFKEAIEDMRSGKVIKPVLLWRKTG